MLALAYFWPSVSKGPHPQQKCWTVGNRGHRVARREEDRVRKHSPCVLSDRGAGIGLPLMATASPMISQRGGTGRTLRPWKGPSAQGSALQWLWIGPLVCRLAHAAATTFLKRSHSINCCWSVQCWKEGTMSGGMRCITYTVLWEMWAVPTLIGA